LQAINFNGEKSMTLFLNNKKVGYYKINNWTSIVESINLHMGENTLNIKIKERCSQPSKIIGSNDTRCINIALRKIKIEAL